MRIVIIGGNGQVASEVVLLLAAKGAIEVVPVARTRGGSAFLRSHNISVVHGNVSNPETAMRILKGADVIANFALAAGSPNEAMRRNRELINRIFSASPVHAKHVFISTISVKGEYDAFGRRRSSFYGLLKKTNEAQVRRLARKLGRETHILRLGHVIGTFQNLSNLIREEILAGTAHVPHPERDANVTSTVSIADYLLRVANGSAGPGGTFDLLNLPQWSWRKVYEFESEAVGVGERIAFTVAPAPLLHTRPSPASILASMITPGVREVLLKLLTVIHPKVESRMRAAYSIARTRRATVPLFRSPEVSNPALVTPAYRPNVPPHQQPTMSIIALAPAWYAAWPRPRGDFRANTPVRISLENSGSR